MNKIQPEKTYNTENFKISLLPIILNPDSFVPYRRIEIEWCPEQLQDLTIINKDIHNNLKDELFSKLEEILFTPIR